MPLPFHRRERHALCDTALALGPDAPTLCGAWTARDLIAHLLVREAPGLGAVGIAVKPLSGLTERAMDRAARAPYDAMVARLRDPGLTPYRLPGVERLVNTVEYVVHHEDLRRAQDPWAPRILPPEDDEQLWTLVRGAARLSSRRLPVPVVAARTLYDDLPPETVTLRRGDDPVVVSGPTVELALFFSGRSEVARVELEGPDDAVARVREADLGF
ncbi:TIGR03085 family protein [Nocardioides anomalus]|uniref:TIGR03085 family protein n=1 Tax=Nocardioides anomalus TaxID=2712223 RepID=A0A6G6WBL2_9ACTN|nr:TIGR03085 family metal-binding protein [Nocardioides anomalus]QIG42614.1 TIGR03085 family protein [Nocardioides anomalus]